ncbi:MAG: hypothetical protein ACK4MM_05780 [Fervidobacterium sp.]
MKTCDRRVPKGFEISLKDKSLDIKTNSTTNQIDNFRNLEKFSTPLQIRSNKS